MPDGPDQDQASSQAEHRHHHPHGDVEMGEIGLTAFGVDIAIAAPADVLSHVRAVLPPESREREPAEDDEKFTLERQENNVYRLWHGNSGISGSSDLQIALEVLDSQLRAVVALHAPEHIFVHAGVVGHRGRAIVIPGRSFSGKTTLVAELVGAGATYYSDEFAVLDSEGLVLPYPKPLSIRPTAGVWTQVDHPVESIGGVAGVEPIPIGLIAIAPYLPDAKWEPERLSPGEALLAVLDNTIPAQTRPEQALSSIKNALDGATVLSGERGEASKVAPELLSAVNGAAAGREG